MEELILIKLGGSIITDKNKEFVAKEDNIKRLAKEIKKSQKVFFGKIIIGHGAGGFAHVPAKKYKTKDGIINSKSLIGMTITEKAARQLNDILTNEFVKENLPIFPFSPASFLLSDAQSYSNSYFDPIKKALEINAIPVVYGDVIMDKKQGFTIFSTEKVFNVLVRELVKFYKIRIILVSDVDGVYNKDGVTIPVITDKNFDQLKESIVGAKGTDITGGMLHKVEESLKLAKEFGVETLIVNGKRPWNLLKAVKGEKTLSTLIKL